MRQALIGMLFVFVLGGCAASGSVRGYHHTLGQSAHYALTFEQVEGHVLARLRAIDAAVVGDTITIADKGGTQRFYTVAYEGIGIRMELVSGRHTLLLVRLAPVGQLTEKHSRAVMRFFNRLDWPLREMERVRQIKA